MKKSNIIAVIVAVVVVIAVVAVAGWFLTHSSPTLLQGEVAATGYKASSKIPGRIEQMLVEEGQKVEKGQLLYRLSTPEIDAKLRAARAVETAAQAKDKMALAGARVEQIDAAMSLWQKAEAGLALAEKSYRRIERLYEQGVVPAQKYDEAEANYQAMKATAAAARSQYEMAKAGTRSEDKTAAKALVEQAASAVSEVEIYQGDALVYSPVTGEVSTVIAEQGELVGAGYPVVALLDMSDLWVEFNVKETLLPRIRVGTRFLGYLPALNREVELEVYYIAVQADFATWAATRTRGGFDVRTFKVKARTSDGQTQHMRPGMSVIVNWDEIAE